MAVYEEPYAVACAMIICFAVVPEILACKHIELRSASAFREFNHSQRNVPFHDEGEVMALLRSGVAQGYCPGDVGGAVGILAA